MRVSSPIAPSLSGTLKSTRTNTRRPATSMSRSESFRLESFLDEQPQQIDAPVRVAPLVVVPREDLHEIAVHHFRVRRVDDRGVRVALEVDRDELVGRDRQD